MSATRLSSRFPGPKGPGPKNPPGQFEPPAPPAAGRKRLLALAIFFAAAWSLALLFMDVWTANPLVVSRDQILKAHSVVIARRVAPGGDKVKVERVFYGNVEAGDTLRVRNLAEVAGFDSERAFLMPLSQFRGDFVVTTLEGQSAAPLVYPASPASIETVKAILRDRL